MKKFLATTLLLPFAFLLCGCNEAEISKNISQKEANDKAVSDVKKETPALEQPKEVFVAKEQKTGLDILTLFSSSSKSDNKLWVGTFQLVFNDMKNNIVKHDIEFTGEEQTPELKGLNSEEFNSTMLQDSSYYTSYGETSPQAKEKIKKDLKQKFNETSAILDTFDWSRGIGKYYAYAMLRKDFHFPSVFDTLDKSSFNNSEKQYDFFGIDSKSDETLYRNVKVLFYKDNNYAVQLLTKEDDIVYLYRTESDKDFKTIYNELINKTKEFEGKKYFDENDTLKVPKLKIKDSREYPELCNKQIAGTEPPLFFSDTIETIELELNEKGGKVKSEAMLMMKMSAISMEDVPRHFDFDKTFVLFLIDKDKNDPYLALRVKNLEGLQ